MKKMRLNYIWVEDLTQRGIGVLDKNTIKVDNNGKEYVLISDFGDDLEMYLKPTAEQLKQKRILDLEEELEGMTEPTNEELIEEGKMMHPYYELIRELESLRK